MAGRGRGMTLPSWVTAEENKSSALGSISSDFNYNNSYLSDNMDSKNSRDESRDIKIDRRDDRKDDRRDDRKDDRRDDRRDDRKEDRRRKSKSRSRDRKHRSRSPRRERSRSREKKSRDESSRTRSKSPPGDVSRGWTSRRKNKSSNFDVKPPDGVVLPPIGGLGSNLNPALGPTGTLLPGMQNLGSSLAATRHARRLYVGGIPAGTTEGEIKRFFGDIMHKALPAEYFKDGDPILLVYVNNDKCFAFVELNSIELTSACCQLDGLQFKGVTLKIRRPNDFRPELLAESHPAPSLHINMSALGVISTTVADGPNKVFVGGLPYHLNEDMVKELLNAFGELKSFHLVRDPGSVLSKGYAFCEYVNPECTRIACEGLNDMQIGDKNLTVRIAAASSSVAPPPPPAPPLSSYSIPGLNAAVGSLQPLMSSSEVPFAMRSPTNNMIMSEELRDDSEYADICEDVKEECSKYGSVKSLVIPRMQDGYPSSSEGAVYVEFYERAMAKQAGQALSGRKFANRIVNVDYFDEIKYANRAFF